MDLLRIFAGFALVILPNMAYANDANLLTVDIRDRDSGYAFGSESIIWQIGVKNQSKKDSVTIRVTGQAEDQFLFKAFNSKKSPVKLDNSFYLTQVNRQSNPAKRPKVTEVTLHPGASWTIPVNLSTVFAFDAAGEYVVQVQVALQPMWENDSLLTTMFSAPLRLEANLVTTNEKSESARLDVSYSTPQAAVEALLDGRMKLDAALFLSPLDFETLMEEYPEYHARYTRVGSAQKEAIMKMFRRHLRETLLAKVEEYELERTLIVKDLASVSVNISTKAPNSVRETFIFQVKKTAKGWKIFHVEAKRVLDKS